MKKIGIISALSLSLFVGCSTKTSSDQINVLDFDLSQNVINPTQILTTDLTEESNVTRPEVLGFRGPEYDRFELHLDLITRRNIDAYHVFGQTRFQGLISPFTGEIIIDSVKAVNNEDCSEVELKDVSERGTIYGHYDFSEFQGQQTRGKYIGQCQYQYLVKNGEIFYDAVELECDGYSNNQYEGFWVSLMDAEGNDITTNPDTIVCNWGDWRIPASGTLDVGAGEFCPSEEARAQHGWGSYSNDGGEQEAWWVAGQDSIKHQL